MCTVERRKSESRVTGSETKLSTLRMGKKETKKLHLNWKVKRKIRHIPAIHYLDNITLMKSGPEQHSPSKQNLLQPYFVIVGNMIMISSYHIKYIRYSIVHH